MDTYSLMRLFADSWFLIVMFAFFLGIVVWAFRPGSAKLHEDMANIPFRNEDMPASDLDASRRATQKELEQ